MKSEELWLPVFSTENQGAGVRGSDDAKLIQLATANKIRRANMLHTAKILNGIKITVTNNGTMLQKLNVGDGSKL